MGADGIPVEVSSWRLAAEEAGADGRLAGTQRLLFKHLLPFVFDGRGRASALDRDGGLAPPRAVLEHLDHLGVGQDAHVDPVDVHQDVAFGQVLAAGPVQDRFHLLAVGAVGDGEPESHGALGDLHRHQLHLASDAQRRRRRRHRPGRVAVHQA